MKSRRGQPSDPDIPQPMLTAPSKMNPAKRLCLRASTPSLLQPARPSLVRDPCRAALARSLAASLAPSLRLPFLASIVRPLSSDASPPPTNGHAKPADEANERQSWRAVPHRRPDEPVYELYFTCKVCKHRSGHSISKQGYHNGTTLVLCPGCNNRHLISDHLKIFSDTRLTLQDILREKGEGLRLGGLDSQGDIEFWDNQAADEAEKDPQADT